MEMCKMLLFSKAEADRRIVKGLGILKVWAKGSLISIRTRMTGHKYEGNTVKLIERISRRRFRSSVAHDDFF